jgi:2-polyprenyl-3-methyl-5-hydroxy-6-metoxy-1,4-benzoquinol methylase
MADHDVLAFVRANLPPPPCRVLEVGAGEGELAAALAAAGYAVTAIDPDPRGEGVHGVALADVTAESGAFDAAVAIRSLHHVHPLDRSLERLADVLQPGAPLVIDEMDVVAFDRRAAGWWLRQRAKLGRVLEVTPSSSSTSTACTCIRCKPSPRRSPPGSISARPCAARGSTGGISAPRSATRSSA